MMSPAQDCRPPGPSLMTARHRLIMCALCRYRHNAHYPDTVVMPISGVSAQVGGGDRVKDIGIISRAAA
jgi:hypothetical protein